MRSATRVRAAVLWAGVAAVAGAAPAVAQAPLYPPPPPPFAAPAPPLSPEAAEIAACLCLGQTVTALSADVAARQRSYEAVHGELSRLDSQQQSARARIDVDNPRSVAQFRQLVEQRDAAFARSGSALEHYNARVNEYNARVNEYNLRCANRPRDPGLLGRVQATLSCPPAY